MERDEAIETMARAFYNDDAWPEGVPDQRAAWDRKWMGRAYDAIAEEIRKDVTMQLLNQVVAAAVGAKP